ncbi:hypothetical protein [Anaerobacillus alkaliphilus]|nr:hypothetical protein [Anaerobacillus alkaliphilus]
MALPEQVLKQNPLRKAKRERSKLLSTATPERLAIINEKSKKNGGLSNLTYERVFGEK